MRARWRTRSGPDAYQAIDNFYTVTVYEKGAEVIRMLQALVGREGFTKGMALYFERHDGQAVTCDDFVRAIADANGRDLSQFERWYSQAGTPAVRPTRWDRDASADADADPGVPADPGQPRKSPSTSRSRSA
jgi:aminopeptidase N